MRKVLLASTFLTIASRMSMPATFEDGSAVFDFPETVDDINTVPERARGLYTEKDGKFIYTDVGGLRNSLQNARNERDAARKTAQAVAKWEKLGKTPEEIEQLLQAQADAEQQRLTDEGDFQTLKQQMETNHANAIGEKDKVIAKYKGGLEKAVIEAGLLTALGDKDVEGNPLFLMPAMRGRVKLEETEDGFNPVVLREDGSPMLNAQNNPATLKDLALEFRGKAEWAGAFKGLNQSGGGASGDGGGNGGGGGATKKRSEMTNIEKVKFIQEHGQAEYEKLPQ